MNHFSASQPICKKRVRERIQRVGFDVSTNLSEREGKRERKRRKEREREKCRRYVWVLVFPRVIESETRGKKKEIDKVLTLISLLSSWTSVVILKEIFKVLYLKFAHLEFMNLGFLD